MKSQIIIALVVVLAQCQSTEFTQGLLNTIQTSFSVNSSDIKDCLVQGFEFSASIEFFKDTVLGTPLTAFNFIGQELQTIPEAIKNCMKNDVISDEISYLINVMGHPIVISEYLVLNGLDISKEIYTIIETSDELIIGEQFGKMLNKILVQRLQIENVLSDTKTVLLQIYSGFIKGFYEEGGINIEDIQTCFADASGAVNDFIGGVQLIASKDPKLVKEGLRLLGMGLQILPEAIRTCKVANQQIQDFSQVLEEAIALLENPNSFAVEIGRHLIVNGRDILKETTRAIQDWNAENYADFGYQLGKIVYQLVVGSFIQEVQI